MDQAGQKVDFLCGADLAAAVAVERRLMPRRALKMIGRLAYGGDIPALVGCEIMDLSETGVRVETYVAIRTVPDTLSIEFAGIYCRVRRRWVKEREVGLEFIYE